MPGFTAEVTVPGAPPSAVWDRVTDWSAHGRWVPLTTVRVLTEGADHVGTEFVARTGLGPAGFDDPMRVTGWAPPAGGLPGRCSVVKTGRVLGGTADLEVRAAGAGSLVRWSEEVVLLPRVAGGRLTAPVAFLVGPVGGFLFTRTLRAMAAEFGG